MENNTKKIEEIVRSLSQGGGIDKKISEIEQLNLILASGETIPVRTFEKIAIVITETLNTSQTRVCFASMNTAESLILQLYNFSNIHTYKSILNFILKALIDRLGDVKLEIRSHAIYLIGKIWEAFNYKSMQQSAEIMNSSFNEQSPLKNKGTLIMDFEKEMANKAFGHKTLRVREMAIQWVYNTNLDYPDFDPGLYIKYIVNQIFDVNDTVRTAAKITLQRLYSEKPEIQQTIADELSQRKGLRPNIITEITVDRRTSGPTRSASNIGSPYREGLSTRVRTPSRTQGKFDSQNVRSSFHVQQQTFSRIKPINPRSDSHLGFIQADIRKLSITPEPTPNRIDRNFQTPRQGAQIKRHPSRSSNLGQDSGNTRQTEFVSRPAQDVPYGILPIIVDSPRAIERELAQWSIQFEGKETEENWNNREKAISHFRRIIWGNAPIDYHLELCRELKKHSMGLLKALNSLRTSLSALTIKLFEEIIVRLWSRSGLMFEFVFENLLKLCSTTKKLINQAALVSLKVIVSVVPINENAIKSILANMESKNVSLRLSGISVSISIVEGRSFEVSGLMDKIASMLAKIVAKGITDSNPEIRAESKTLYKKILLLDSTLSERILSLLEPKNRSALFKLQKSPLSSPISPKNGSNADNPRMSSTRFKQKTGKENSPGSLGEIYDINSQYANTQNYRHKPRDSYTYTHSSESLSMKSVGTSVDSERSAIVNITPQNNTSRQNIPEMFTSQQKKSQTKGKSDTHANNERGLNLDTELGVWTPKYSFTARKSLNNSGVSNTQSAMIYPAHYLQNEKDTNESLVLQNPSVGYSQSRTIVNEETLYKDSDLNQKYSNDTISNSDQNFLLSQIVLGKKHSDIEQISPISKREIGSGYISTEFGTNEYISSNIYSAFGIYDNFREYSSAIIKYMKVQEIIDGLTKNVTDKKGKIRYYKAQDTLFSSAENIKTLSRLIKDSECSWLWGLSPLPWVNSVSLGEESSTGNILKRCPLPDFSRKKDIEGESGEDEVDIKYGTLRAEKETDKSEDPLLALHSSRVLGYAIEMFSTFISNADPNVVEANLHLFMGQLVKGVVHPRVGVRKASVFGIISIKEKLDLSDELMADVLSNKSLGQLSIEEMDVKTKEAGYDVNLDDKYKNKLSFGLKVMLSYLLLLDHSYRNLITIMNNEL
ncbi:hypothetical protein BB558_001778 [Smittium angustum]|uniref:CLASP N-terminal domain-containing protein n=1 Tax=Smittium angustum TaxID=133377 RepID=A0A2U1JAN9_SMIAN|nr:hypothetical protein BB558_001778 [Smittium angustum]